VRGSTNHESLVPRATKFRTVATNIFSLITAVFFCAYRNVYQFTCTAQKAQITVRLTRHYRIVCL